MKNFTLRNPDGVPNSKVLRKFAGGQPSRAIRRQILARSAFVLFRFSGREHIPPLWLWHCKSSFFPGGLPKILNLPVQRCRAFYLCENLVQLLPVQQTTRNNHGANAPNVRDVRQRIRIEQNKIGRLSWRHDAERLLKTEIPRSIGNLGRGWGSGFCD